MPIRSVADILAAYDAGRVHVQRFTKNALTGADIHWHDWAYAGGQPAFDARVGIAGQFNPFVAARNDAIWFPNINPDQERYLAGMTLRTSAVITGQITTDAVVYDLLGVYPLIDGASTDIQPFDNTLTLPRYESGVGVVGTLVNHVAPVLSSANVDIIYTDNGDATRTSNSSVLVTGPGRSVSAMLGGLQVGPVSFPLGAGSAGIKNIQSLQFNVPPGGLFSLYLFKQLAFVNNSDGALAPEKIATERSFIQQNGWAMPRIYDGAHLGMFLRTNGLNRAVTSIFGNMEFIWG